MQRQTWIVTGGSGYIGSHVADMLLESGIDPIIIDQLSYQSATRIKHLEAKYGRKVAYVESDIRNSEPILAAIDSLEINGIIHTAALKSVSDSVSNPNLYMDVNVNGTKALLDIAKTLEIRNFIFSSSAAVYGKSDKETPVSEEDLTSPESPYGLSKLQAELHVLDFLSQNQNGGAILRYFNVVGTSTPELVDDSMGNLLPIVIKKLSQGETVEIFGGDYSTIDGTCIRDYIDVRDVAKANLAVVEHPRVFPGVINVGSGEGTSVLEVIEIAADVMGIANPDISFKERRSGDSPAVFASIERMKEHLGVENLITLRAAVISALKRRDEPKVEIQE
jgi:UDP-glucose 4-epimerase